MKNSIRRLAMADFIVSGFSEQQAEQLQAMIDIAMEKQPGATRAKVLSMAISQYFHNHGLDDPTIEDRRTPAEIVEQWKEDGLVQEAGTKAPEFHHLQKLFAKNRRYRAAPGI